MLKLQAHKHFNVSTYICVMLYPTQTTPQHGNLPGLHDENNWSVFQRRTQDPPIDETTSIYASLILSIRSSWMKASSKHTR